MEAIPKSRLNLSKQEYHLKKIFPDSETRIINNHSELEWDGCITPSAFSITYSINLNYRLDKRPKVQVSSPKLEIPDDCSQIHLFNDHSLCLHMRGEWSSDQVIAKTIIPWTSEWLMHYELWQLTGNWHGGGQHFDNKSSYYENEEN